MVPVRQAHGPSDLVLGFGPSRAPVAAETSGSETTSPNAEVERPEDTLALATRDGDVIVRDFSKGAAYITQDKLTVVLNENKIFTIVYNRSDQKSHH
jgi:hypothetical protein